MGGVSASLSRRPLLLDANVVIDFQRADLAILGISAGHHRSVAILGQVLDEVDGLTREDCGRLGIEVLKPTTAQEFRAEEIPSAISVTDRLCLVVSQDEQRTCVTNDRRLRNLCERHGVATIYGLRLMLDLVAAGALSRQRAEEVAREIRSSDPLRITEDILTDFRDRLDALPERGETK